MNVVRKIWMQPASGETLTSPTVIKSARLLESK
jgi:hypothetical protein